MIIVLIALLAVACGHRRSGDLYFDYRVSGEEGQDNVTVMLRYQLGGPEGPAVPLPPEARVELDGQPLPADSASLTGTFYEAMITAGAFAGTHHIVYTDADGKQHNEEFVFRPMTLRTPLPEVVTRGDLVIELDGLNAEDFVRVLMVDTSYAGREISRLDTVKNGRILISGQDLATLSDGPVMLELSREENRPLKKSTRRSGRFNSIYTLKREFELQTQP